MLLWDCEKAGYKRYRFVTEGDSCELCSSLDGQIFDIKDAKSGANLAPMHPNCDCSAVVLDENSEIVLAIGGKNSENLDGRFVRISNNLNEILNEFYRAKVVLYKKFGVGDKNEYMDISSPEEAEDKYILSEDDYKLVKVYTQLFHYFDTFGEIEKRDAVRLAIVHIRQKDEYKNRYSKTMSDGVYVDGYRYSSKVKEVDVSGVVMTEGYAYSLGGKNLKNDLFMKMITKFDKTDITSKLEALRDLYLFTKQQREELKKGAIHVSIRKRHADERGLYWSYDNIFFDKDCRVMFWEKN